MEPSLVSWAASGNAVLGDAGGELAELASPDDGSRGEWPDAPDDLASGLIALIYLVQLTAQFIRTLRNGIAVGMRWLAALAPLGSSMKSCL
jgi:hypothetical protein